ncbi:Maestro heat-like repeat-containing protein member 1 [Bulinus truncatus]|nr:Maestro heat-like repeat-containing protein member 1 [Bulinus truncatus]
MSGPNEDGVWHSGGQVDEIALALIDVAHDNDQMTREVIANALFDLGKKKPALILNSCHTYLKKHSKLSLEHRIIILNTIEKILKETLDSVKTELAINLIKQASSELTQSKLRLAIIEAVGHMTHIISKEKLQEQLPKILQGIFCTVQTPFRVTSTLHRSNILLNHYCWID